MRGLLGKKIGMTTYFAENGSAVPVTVVEVGPCSIIQIKTTEKEGYNAFQIGYEALKPKFKTVFRNNKKVKKHVRPVKPMEGHFKKAEVQPLRHILEIKTTDTTKYNVGDEVKIDIFNVDEKVDVSGITKGRGFTGGVKRWGWGGGRASHGSMFHRRVGSVGQSSSPSKIFKNKKMPGHYGAAKRTVQNLTVIKIDPEKNVMLIKGSIPGANGNVILVKKAAKVSK